MSMFNNIQDINPDRFLPPICEICEKETVGDRFCSEKCEKVEEKENI